jgi:hypothetical protein
VKPLSLSAWAALAILSASNCARPSPWTALSERLRAPNGAILIFDPATCEVTQVLFHQLNSLDAARNARVLGLVLDTDTVATPLARIAADFDVSFRLESTTRQELGLVLSSAPLRLPVLLIYRYGELVSIESIEPERGSQSRYVIHR